MRFTRSSGILLHSTSLSELVGTGGFGAPSYHFIDRMLKTGQSLWQLLPLRSIGLANFPYMSLLAFSGQQLQNDLHELVSNRWLISNTLEDALSKVFDRINYQEVIPFRMNILAKAF